MHKMDYDRFIYNIHNNRDIIGNKKEQQFFNEKNKNLNEHYKNNNDRSDGPKDSISNKNKNNNLKDNKNINDYINEVLIKKDTKLITDSKYVTFENKIGENACYVNVIIHLLYKFPCINDYLIKKLSEKINKEKVNEENTKKENENKENKNIIEESSQEKNIKIDNKIKIETINKKKKDENFNEFLFVLGSILNDYQKFLSSENTKDKINKLNTSNLRKSLSISSNNLFKLNNVSDPIEFLIYILDLINKENSDEIHTYFHLKLIEEIRCSKFCPYKSNKKYDKDNFIYHIYVEDIINYIKKYQLKFEDYKLNLFMLSFYSMQNEDIKCEKCKSPINKTLICNNDQNSPKILLINCIWNNAKPNLENVINFFFLISLKEELDNLFICPNKDEKDYYYLIGIIFYSYTLCHYINMTFNIEKKVFTLYNDEGIIEFNEIIDLFKYLTIEQLKYNDKAFFYPVLLVYGKENLYDENMINGFNKIDFNYYNKFVDECDSQIKKKEIIKEKPLTKEEKDKNYRELVIAQMKYDREQEINNLLNKSSAYRKGDCPKNFGNDYNKQFNFNNELNKTQKTLNNFGNNSRKQKDNKRGASYNNPYINRFNHDYLSRQMRQNNDFSNRMYREFGYGY